jgi:alpha-beta hydrolase superfamily lysophospholipase
MRFIYYKDQETWKEISAYLPPGYRIEKEPREHFITWNNSRIHIDHYENNHSPAKIILLHGVGGNGRLLSFIGAPLSRCGYEIISPDLPGYGLSIVNKKKVLYTDWVELGCHLVESELKKDDRPVFLFGLSAGGMLAYQVAAKCPQIKGVIATNLLDQRNQAVRDHSAGNIIVSRLGILGLKLLSKVTGEMLLPMKVLANLKAIVNDNRVMRLLLNDPTSSGTKVPVNFVLSLIRHKPVTEPENFSIPVLMVHPELDKWTPVEISNIFFNRIGSEKELVILKNAGHFPIEQPGLDQLRDGVNGFIEKHLV